MPKIYTPDNKAEVIAAVLTLVDEGKSLRQACAEIDFPRKTFEGWIDSDQELSAQYERARANRSDKIFEEMLTIQDERPEDVIQAGSDGEGGSKRIDPAFVAWQKNRVDVRKWMLSKMAPKRFGDRVELEHSGEVKSAGPDLSRLPTEDLTAMRAILAKVDDAAPANPR